MGLFSQITTKLFTNKVPIDRGSYIPRLANYKVGDTTLAYDDKTKKMVPIDTRHYLFDTALEMLESGRRTVTSWRSCDIQKASLTGGCGAIPSYWWAGYSAGFACEKLAGYIDEFLSQCTALDDVITRRYPAMPHNRIEDVGSNYASPYLQLGWLVGLGARHDQITSYLEYTGVAGQDVLFDRLVVKLGFERKVASSLRFPKEFQPTLTLLDAPEVDKPTLIEKILKTWVKTRYTNPQIMPGEPRYLGHWATDIALIVMLWDVDDTSFQDHPNYPRDLVTFYRSKNCTQKKMHV